MKKFVLGIAVIFLLLILMIVLLPFFVDLNQYQDQYLPLVENALNREVSLEDIQLTVYPKLGIRLAGVTIQDDPAFSPSPFLSLHSLDLGVKLWPLLSKRVEVEEIILREPVITLVKNRKGQLNISTLQQKPNGESSPSAGSPDQPNAETETPNPLLALLAVERSQCVGGTLTYRDQSTGTETRYDLKDFNLHLNSVKLHHSPTLHLDTVVHPFNLPVTIDGSFGPLRETPDLEDIDLNVALGKTQLAIKGSVLKGTTKLSATSPVINTTHLPLTLPIEKPVKIEHVSLSSTLDERQIMLHNLSFNAFGGKAVAEGTLGLGQQSPPFTSSVRLKNIQIGPLAETLGTSSVSLSGLATLTLDLSGRGFSHSDLTQHVHGNSSLLVTEGKIEGLNILKQAIVLLRSFGVNEEIADTTVISKLEGQVSLKKGTAFVEHLQLDSQDFQAFGKGTIGFDQTLNLQTTLLLSESLSTQIANSAPAVKMAMRGSRVSLPLTIRGTLHTPVYGIESKSFQKKIQDQVQKEVQKAVDDLLQGKRSPEDILKQGENTLRQFFGQ